MQTLKGKLICNLNHDDQLKVLLPTRLVKQRHLHQDNFGPGAKGCGGSKVHSLTNQRVEQTVNFDAQGGVGENRPPEADTIKTAIISKKATTKSIFNGQVAFLSRLQQLPPEQIDIDSGKITMPAEIFSHLTLARRNPAGNPQHDPAGSFWP